MFKKSLVAIFVLIWLLLAIDPVNRDIWVLENFLVVMIFPVVLWLDNKYNFTNASFLSLTLFVVLHLFGAHMTYEKMAYFTWFSEMFDLQRNYYDQAIHFLFGLMVFAPFFEIFYHQRYTRKLSYLLAILFISGISSVYEILEWLAMVVFCNGPDCVVRITQGDDWDTQKDMAYALIGGVMAMLLHYKWADLKESASVPEKA